MSILGTFDAVVGPTVPIVAPTIDEARRDPTLPALLVSNTRLANVTGTPAITVPAPTDAADPAATAGDGALPVGLQLMAATDAAALGIAAFLPWQAGIR